MSSVAGDLKIYNFVAIDFRNLILSSKDGFQPCYAFLLLKRILHYSSSCSFVF
jgi:hypothetical protein